jgi:hypothetical protein
MDHLFKIGNLKIKENTKQQLHDYMETELQILQVSNTNYRRNMNMMAEICSLDLHLLVIPVNLIPSVYYVS